MSQSRAVLARVVSRFRFPLIVMGEFVDCLSELVQAEPNSSLAIVRRGEGWVDLSYAGVGFRLALALCAPRGDQPAAVVVRVQHITGPDDQPEDIVVDMPLDSQGRVTAPCGFQLGLREDANLILCDILPLILAASADRDGTGWEAAGHAVPGAGALCA